MRVLALDWGEVRVGAAVSDPSGKIAFPLDKIFESKNAITEIKKLAVDLGIEKIIVGNPKNLSGQDSSSSEKVSAFIKKLQSETNLSVEVLDERFSSVEAGKLLDEQGFDQRQQRKIKDNIAAHLILQQYLNKN